jgi:hypothetical protein
MIRKIETVGKILIGFLFLGSGFLLAYASYHVTAVGLSGANWITAQTTITYTYSVRAWGSRYRGSGLEYVLSPTYSFVAADGKTYVGHTYDISWGDKTDRHTASEEELKKNLIENGQLFYNPKDPNQSAVEQPYFDPVMPFFFAVFAILIIGMAIALIVHEVHLLKSHKERHQHREPALNFGSGN